MLVFVPSLINTRKISCHDKVKKHACRKRKDNPKRRES